MTLLLPDLPQEAIHRIVQYAEYSTSALLMTFNKQLVAKMKQLPLKVNVWNKTETAPLTLCSKITTLELYNDSLPKMIGMNFMTNLVELCTESKHIVLFDVLPSCIEVIWLTVTCKKLHKIRYVEEQLKKLPDTLRDLSIDLKSHNILINDGGNMRPFAVHVPTQLQELRVHQLNIGHLPIDADTHPMLTKLVVDCIFGKEQLQKVPRSITSLRCSYFGDFDDLSVLPLLTKAKVACMPVMVHPEGFPHLVKLHMQGHGSNDYNLHLPQQLKNFSYRGHYEGKINWDECKLDYIRWPGFDKVPCSVYSNAKFIVLQPAGDPITFLDSVSEHVELLDIHADVFCTYDFSRFKSCKQLWLRNVMPFALPKHLNMFCMHENMYKASLTHLVLPETLQALHAKDSRISVKQISQMRMMQYCTVILTDEIVADPSCFDHLEDTLEVRLHTTNTNLRREALASIVKPKVRTEIIMLSGGEMWE